MGLHVVETPNTELSTACASAQRSGAVLVTRPSIDQRSAADLGAAGVSGPDVGPVLPPGSLGRPHRVIRIGSLMILLGIHQRAGASFQLPPTRGTLRGWVGGLRQRRGLSSGAASASAFRASTPSKKERRAPFEARLARDGIPGAVKLFNVTHLSGENQAIPSASREIVGIDSFYMAITVRCEYAVTGQDTYSRRGALFRRAFELHELSSQSHRRQMRA
jgi:hypothetical protein